MSGGRSTSSVNFRQRCSQGYSSSGDDLEDDACSRTYESVTLVHQAKGWDEVMENVLWLVSAAFIVYYGDQRQNLLFILWSDSRINRKALHLGLLAVVLDMCLIVYTVFLAKDSKKKSYDGNEALRTNALLVVLLGFFSFCLLSRGLWPIWGFLTIPLLFTLLMASMVVFPSLKIGTSRPQSSVIRTD
ncbi:hypothetical protein HPP92_002794 [Vanilla planifolia]|uniref:Transmembrane protein n=1 Tax=Vanilla planifolia TaxID=51239 RepID=A0A835RWI6_VANPL|nr:hypothetical protein HPP92_002794 [Vanilla planifolia]